MSKKILEVILNDDLSVTVNTDLKTLKAKDIRLALDDCAMETVSALIGKENEFNNIEVFTYYCMLYFADLCNLPDSITDLRPALAQLRKNHRCACMH